MDPFSEEEKKLVKIDPLPSGSDPEGQPKRKRGRPRKEKVKKTAEEIKKARQQSAAKARKAKLDKLAAKKKLQAEKKPRGDQPSEDVVKELETALEEEALVEVQEELVEQQEQEVIREIVKDTPDRDDLLPNTVKTASPGESLTEEPETPEAEVLSTDTPEKESPGLMQEEDNMSSNVLETAECEVTSQYEPLIEQLNCQLEQLQQEFNKMKSETMYSQLASIQGSAASPVSSGLMTYETHFRNQYF